MLELQTAELDALPLEYSDHMRFYQRTMANFGVEAKRYINGDDRGLGKTLDAIAVAELAKAKKVLIVCPGYLKLGWIREIKKWTGDSSYITQGGRDKRTQTIKEYFNSPARFMTVNYEMIRSNEHVGGYPELLLYPWDMIIFDEAHRLKGRRSQWTEGAKQITKKPNIQLLSGTPLDRPDDIWQLLNLINPLKFSSYWAFVEYYCVMVDNFFGREIAGINQTRMAQLQYTIQPYLLRRSKKQVAPELPEKIFHPIYVELEGKQKSFYKRLEKQMVIELAGGDLKLITAVAAKQLRLQQAIANPAILGGVDDSVVERTCLDLLEDLLASEGKVIVGTWFVPAADSLEKKIGVKWKVFRIKSSLEDIRRDEIVEAFKTCKEKCVLVGTIGTLGEGLNIDECDYIIRCDKSWAPRENEQFEDRIHRLTSTRKKNYYDIIVANTTSEDKETVLQERIETRDEILSMEKIAAMMQRKAAELMMQRVKDEKQLTL
ncbi:MAG: RNA polymerase-associated protein RapA [Syntrophomonadaceae bacterium]|nr:RNA polymerase-associated protein RapA [Bacillota bacterium]